MSQVCWPDSFRFVVKLTWKSSRCSRNESGAQGSGPDLASSSFLDWSKSLIRPVVPKCHSRWPGHKIYLRGLLTRQMSGLHFGEPYLANLGWSQGGKKITLDHTDFINIRALTRDSRVNVSPLAAKVTLIVCSFGWPKLVFNMICILSMR